MCNKEMCKTQKKMMKIDKNSQYFLRKYSCILNDLRNFNEIFRKIVTYDNVKSHKKAGFHHLFRKNMFEKTTEEGGGGKGGAIQNYFVVIR